MTVAGCRVNTQHSAAGVVAIVFKQLEDFVAVSETLAMGLHCVA